MIFTQKKRVNRGFKVKTASIPAPIGGLNARDSIADMPETDAIVLDNWFPSPTDIAVRNGSILQNAYPTDWVETIMAYNGPVSRKIFSADRFGDIREVTTSITGAVAALTGLTSARFQYVNFATIGGNFMLAVNGSDKLRGYDDTNWWTDGDGTHDITGVDSRNLIHANIFKSRIWFTEKNSTRAWYLPLNSIAGAAISFDLGSLFLLGGYLMGMVTWTINDSSGTDDYAAFVSSEGEVLVYKGYDPTYASTWAIAGHFRMGRPIGRRFYTKVGSDIVMITADGAVMLSKALLSDRSAIQQAISNKITNLISNDVTTYNANFGWQLVLYPIGNKLIVNVPASENNRQYQYVMNTITNAWCTFGKVNSSSAWNAACFEISNDKLYYGGNGAVYQCDVGSADLGSNIQATAKPAFSYFNMKGIQKLFTMIRPYFLSTGRIFVAIGINIDFQDTNPTSLVPVNPGTNQSLWNVALWNVSSWFGMGVPTKDWQSVTGLGVAATTKITVSTSQPLSMQAIDYVFQPGGIL